MSSDLVPRTLFYQRNNMTFNREARKVFFLWDPSPTVGLKEVKNAVDKLYLDHRNFIDSQICHADCH
jgi:hypothetical protein